MFDRIPIRARLTGSFVLATALLLTITAVFVFLRVSADLDEALDDSLRLRADDLAALAQQGSLAEALEAPRAADSEEGFSELLATDGTVLASTLPPGAEFRLTAAQLERARSGELLASAGAVPGIEGDTRIIALPAEREGRPVLVVAGSSSQDRDDTLAGLLKAFAVVTPVAIGLGAVFGWLLAGVGLRPVEAMRRRASEITLARSGERLPLPEAEDEIRHLAETLNTMLGRLEEALMRERRFVADAGHELRTPLAVLTTELELALAEDEPARLQAAVASALEETERLTNLAEDLLVAARSEQPGPDQRAASVDLAELARRTTARQRRAAAEAGRELALELDDGVVLRGADDLRLERALTNLIDNALRHGEGRIEVCVGAREGWAVLSVADQGAGFPEQFAGNAFERFSRAEAARSKPGAGLGLAIVRSVARAHGGEAAIGPAQAQVTIRLPCEPPPV